MQAARSTYEIIYNGANITKSVLPYVISFTYTDKTNGESDELEIALEDKDGLWRNQWYPKKEDTITARITNLGNVLECGTFTIDEISGSGGNSGNTITLKGIAAGINIAMRTKRSYAHENKTLREIANTIASKNGLTVEGNVPDIRIGRRTQYRMTDLHFLQKLGNEFGLEFSVRDKKLIFTSIFGLEDKSPVLTFKPGDLISWSITDKTADTYKNAEVAYNDPQTKEVISSEKDEDNEAFMSAKPDTLVLTDRVENKQQAEVKAKVALYNANSLQQEGSLEIPGNVYAVAGLNCALQAPMGKFSGVYYIKSSTHSVSRGGGYKTSLEIKRVGMSDT